MNSRFDLKFIDYMFRFILNFFTQLFLKSKRKLLFVPS